MMKSTYSQEQGQILVLALIVVGLVMVNTIVILGSSLTFFQNTAYSISSIQATNLAEAGLDKAVASLNRSGGSYAGESETQLGHGSYEVTVSTSGNEKIIESTGYIPSKAEAKSRRTIKIKASKGVGVSFSYAVQVGDGGLEMDNGNTIVGSIYSNGNIVATNNNEITGDAYVAGGTASAADQSVSCAGVNCSDYQFGKDISGQNRLDIAQSFRPSVTGLLNKVSIRIKKIGSPSDITVRILSDLNGNPNKSNVLATGTLYASLASSTYSYIDISFIDSPSLTASNLYWLVIDTTSNNSNYWAWEEDSSQSYTLGGPKWSSDWQVANPVWTSISSDLVFQTFSGGVITSIDGGNNFEIGGNAYAHTIRNATIDGGAHYQVITNSTASSYFPGSPDPAPRAMPISDANIQDWKDEAEEAGITNTNITQCVSTLGPGKIVGNVTFDNLCNITINTPLWITGALTLKNNNTLRLATDFGTSSGIVIVDGASELNNGNKLLGSGTQGSYLMLLSTFDSTVNLLPAIDVLNSGNTGVLYAGKGEIQIHNSNSFTEATAWRLDLKNNATITYDSGLAGMFFSSGPTGSYSIIRGTYQLK